MIEFTSPISVISEPVVTTAGNVHHSLRSGRPISAVPHFLTFAKEMEDTLFNTLLGIGLVGWIRPFFDRPSEAQIKEVGSSMINSGRRPLILTAALVLGLMSIGGLVGMFFAPQVFRWPFLAGTVGMIVGTWFLPIASNKPRRDVFFAEALRLVDGAILVLAFTTR